MREVEQERHNSLCHFILELEALLAHKDGSVGFLQVAKCPGIFFQERESPWTEIISLKVLEPVPENL